MNPSAKPRPKPAASRRSGAVSRCAPPEPRSQISIAVARNFGDKIPMLSRACSAAVNGIDAYAIEVEVNCGYGDTFIALVGLPDAAVKESKDRVSTALANSGYKFPMGKTTRSE